MAEAPPEWNAAAVRIWLQSRIAAARSDQVLAERGGYQLQDDCDKAAAEEMVCTLVTKSADTQSALADALRALLDRDDFIWRGVYNDAKFDRHVRGYIRKVAKMAKLNTGFGNTTHYQ
ncbi:hypothetical protein [Sphingomonas sp. GC_Shp_3]|uniref:hypothetical protein n=1 Tax=Sphingomonas sp. GC_Shp_3 TaxID=2937383 RepID=UPI002269DC2E|nr:hypothetical protein [Sphingomonas sp. GC_Shp_3]